MSPCWPLKEESQGSEQPPLHPGEIISLDYLNNIVDNIVDIVDNIVDIVDNINYLNNYHHHDDEA